MAEDDSWAASFALAIFLAMVAAVVSVRRRLRLAAERKDEVRLLASLAAAEADLAQREYSTEQCVPVLLAVPEAAEQLGETVSAGKDVCAVCLQPTKSRCKRCKAVKYCSSKCQFYDWRQGHKDRCYPPGGQIGAELKRENTRNSVDNVVTGQAQESLESSKSLPSATGNSRTDKIRSVKIDHDEKDNSELKEDASKISRVAPSHIPKTSEIGNLRSRNFASKISSVSATFESVNDSKHLERTASVAENNESLKHDQQELVSGKHSSVWNDRSGGTNVSRTAGKFVTEERTSRKSFGPHIDPIVSRHTPDKLPGEIHFPYEEFVKLYGSNKMLGQPFGLFNVGNSCYANVVLQSLAFTHPLGAYLLEKIHSRKCSTKLSKGWCFTCEFEKLVIEGDQRKSSLSPFSILSHLNDICNFRLGRQEDAHEFLRYVISIMQSIPKREGKQNGSDRLAEESSFVQHIFGGYQRSKIRCRRCNGSSKLFERILDLAVEIDGDVRTLEDALRKYVRTEVLDGDDKYYCPRCNSRQSAKKKINISEAPNVLTIALKRFRPGINGKISKVVQFQEYLNLAPYMSGDEDKSPDYFLYSVVVHVGEMSTDSGHYICYVKNVQGKWYNINDDRVSAVSLETVLSECAYLLFYARASPRPLSTVTNRVSKTSGVPNFNKDSYTHRGGQVQGSNHFFDHSDSELSSPSDCFSQSDGSSSTLSTDSGCTESSRNSTSTEEQDWPHHIASHQQDCLAGEVSSAAADASSSGRQAVDRPKGVVGSCFRPSAEGPAVLYSGQSKQSSRGVSQNCRVVEADMANRSSGGAALSRNTVKNVTQNSIC